MTAKPHSFTGVISQAPEARQRRDGTPYAQLVVRTGEDATTHVVVRATGLLGSFAVGLAEGATVNIAGMVERQQCRGHRAGDGGVTAWTCEASAIDVRRRRGVGSASVT